MITNDSRRFWKGLVILAVIAVVVLAAAILGDLISGRPIMGL
jgi:hypothetical protein